MNNNEVINSPNLFFCDDEDVDNDACVVVLCEQNMIDNPRRDMLLREGKLPISWPPSYQGGLGIFGGFPCLHNMPSGALSYP